MKLLFLDDIREPINAFEYTKDSIYTREDWNVVRNYEEFMKWIADNGIPDIISFDHDLAPSHYTPIQLWTDYEKSKEWQEAQVHTEKTGYDCVVEIVNISMNSRKTPPICLFHSQNPVGNDKMKKLWNHYICSR